MSRPVGRISVDRRYLQPRNRQLLVAELAGRGLKVDYHSVWDFVHAEKLSFKKSVVAGERDRPDVARRRAQWTK